MAKTWVIKDGKIVLGIGITSWVSTNVTDLSGGCLTARMIQETIKRLINA